MGIIFLIILVDLIGFGIMVPIFAFYALQLGAGPGMATALMALYSGAMFIATPILGRLSDRYGRKPVLALSLLGATAGYVVLGLADTLWLVAVSRLLSGFMAGNISTAQAYITDITSEEDRAKGMGLIGAAFGLGFIIGPALGSWMAGDSFEDMNLFAPAMASAGMTALALLGTLFLLPESLPPEARRTEGPRRTMRSEFGRLRADGILMLLIAAGLTFNLAAGFFEAIFPIWGAFTSVLSGPQAMAPVLLVAGLVMAIIQGGLIGPLTKRFGESNLVRAGALLVVAGMITLVLAAGQSAYSLVILGVSLQGAGSALILTSLQSLTSRRTDQQDRGLVMGLFSGGGTLGRTIGTMLTGWVFANVHYQAPYILSAGLMLVVLLLTFAARPRHTSPKTTD